MHKKLTIILDERVYEGLHTVIGRRKVSQFIESLVRPHVVDVDIEEGCRIPTNLVEVDPDPSNPGETIRVGMPVEVVWDDRTDKITIPMFRPA